MPSLWCNRCGRSFPSRNALNQHIRDSRRHYECPECNFDGETWDDLLEHCRETECRKVCQGCNYGQGSHWGVDCDEYWEHVDDFNVCEDCEQHFSAPANLYQHQLSHLAAEIECYRCYRKFKTYGGMIIHLETGSCNDTDAIELNQLAAECHKWIYFIDQDYRDELLDYGELQDDGAPYYCPTCQVDFRKLSSLFQHVESSACEQTLNDNVIGQLRNFLASRLA